MPVLLPRLFLATLLVSGFACAPAVARVRAIDSIAQTTRGRWIKLHASPKPAAPPAKKASWRPKWWPKTLPEGRTGVVIKLKQQRVYVQAPKVDWTAFSCSTGAKHPTPCGVFKVTEKIRKPSWTYKGQHVVGGIPGNPLGVCWLGLGMPRTWTGAPIGMHGTNAPWFIGHPASHGCIRLRNQDALKLFRMVPVGTPVYIMP